MFRSWSEVPKGTFFKVKSNSNSHNYKIGDIYEVNYSSTHNVDREEANNVAINYSSGNYLKLKDVSFVLVVNFKNEAVRSQLKQKDLELANDILKVAEDSGELDMDIKLYALYKAIQNIETIKADIPTAKKILKNINNSVIKKYYEEDKIDLNNLLFV
jgi:predicted nucleotidyltransferase